MKMREFQTENDLLDLRSRETRGPFASMSFPIVNTPFAHNSAAKPDLHFIGNRGILLHREMAGNYPRIPGITLGLGLVHYPLLPVTHRFALLI
jgi:hypothetical protein